MARENPVVDAVNIPAQELRLRQAELPSKDREVILCAGLPGEEEAAEWLRRQGWPVLRSRQWCHGAETGGRLWSPNSFLENWVQTKGAPRAALDLGCGAGRDAVFLASLQCAVLAVDRLDDNLERGRSLASQYLDGAAAASISWLRQDVLSPRWKPPRKFDLVLSFFLFDRRLLVAARDWVLPGGTLLLEAFTSRRQQTHGRPRSPDRVVPSGQGPTLFDGWILSQLEEADRPPGHTIRIAASPSA